MTSRTEKFAVTVVAAMLFGVWWLPLALLVFNAFEWADAEKA